MWKPYALVLAAVALQLIFLAHALTPAHTLRGPYDGASDYCGSLDCIAVRISGSGHVSSSPSGINCPTTCVLFGAPPLDTVTLKASPSPGWILSGWTLINGPICEGAASCTLSAGPGPFSYNVRAIFTRSK